MEEKAMDTLYTEYLELRALRDKLRHTYEAEDKLLEDKMLSIESTMLDVLNAANANSISTDVAVVMRRVSRRYNPTNWDDIYKLVAKYEAYGLLHKRIHDTNMKDFLDQHPEEYPASLNVDSRYAVTVRRQSST